MGTTGGHCQFQHHVIVGVPEIGTPEIENVLQVALSSQVAEESERLIRSAAWREMFGARQDCLPLGVQADGQGDFELWIRKLLDQAETHPQSRFRGCNQNRSVECDSHLVSNVPPNVISSSHLAQSGRYGIDALLNHWDCGTGERINGTRPPTHRLTPSPTSTPPRRVREYRAPSPRGRRCNHSPRPLHW